MKNHRLFYRVLGCFGLASVGAVAQPTQAARLSAVPQSKLVGRNLSVVEEAIRIRCKAKAERLDCSSESVLDVENPAPSATIVTFEVDHWATKLVVAGEVVPLVTPEGQFVLDGQATLPPGRSKIVVTIPKAFQLDASVKSAEVLTPVLVTRHPQLGKYPGRPAGAELTLQSVAVTKRWKEVKRTRITVVYPGDWERLSQMPECSNAEVTETGCAKKLEDGNVELQWVSIASSENHQPISRLLPLAPKAGLLTNGGFLFGLGWGGGGDCLACVDATRARVAYEVGINTRDLLAFAVEYSPTKRLLLVPTVDRAVFPNLGAIPAITVGVGFPLKVSTELEAGVRGQASLTWPVKKTVSLGVVGMVDILLRANGFHTPVGVGLQMGI